MGILISVGFRVCGHVSTGCPTIKRIIGSMVKCNEWTCMKIGSLEHFFTIRSVPYKLQCTGTQCHGSDVENDGCVLGRLCRS